MRRVLLMAALGLATGERVHAGSTVWALDNDRFGNQDQGYTSGVEAAFSSENVAWGVGQHMFTPRNPSLSLPDPHDRPYVGWLYGAREQVWIDGRQIDVSRWTVGVIGPASGAQRVQNAVHNALGVPRFQGWPHQLRNEPTLSWSGTRWWRTGVLGGPVWGAETAAHADAQAGTVRTSGTGGVLVRWGRLLGSELPPGKQGAYGWTGPWASNGYRNRWTFFAWAGAEASWVLHDTTLDGSLWRDSPSVPKIPWVGELSAGLSVLRGSWTASFVWHRRSREFRGQAETPRYGGLTIAAAF